MARWEYLILRIQPDDIAVLDSKISGEDVTNTRLNKLVAQDWEIYDSNLSSVRQDSPVVLLLRREKKPGGIGFGSKGATTEEE